MPRGRPAVLRGLVADWPAVAAAKAGEEALANFLRKAASEEPFEAWFGPPEIGGRFGYNDGFERLQPRAAAGDGRTTARPSAPPARSRSAFLDVCGRDSDPEASARPAAGNPDALARPEARDADLALARQSHAHGGALGPAAEPSLRRCRAAQVHAVSDRSAQEPLRRPAGLHTRRAADQPRRPRESGLRTAPALPRGAGSSGNARSSNPATRSTCRACGGTACPRSTRSGRW